MNICLYLSMRHSSVYLSVVLSVSQVMKWSELLKKHLLKTAGLHSSKLLKNIYQALLLKWINLFINYDIVFVIYYKINNIILLLMNPPQHIGFSKPYRSVSADLRAHSVLFSHFFSIMLSLVITSKCFFAQNVFVAVADWWITVKNDRAGKWRLIRPPDGLHPVPARHAMLLSTNQKTMTWTFSGPPVQIQLAAHTLAFDWPNNLPRFLMCFMH